MALRNGEQSTELLRAQSHVLNHIFSFINSMSLKCAIQLGIPDIIHSHGKPMTLQELVDALPINKAKANGVYRLMRILINSGFFIEQKIANDEEIFGYWLTDASRLLLKDEPISLVPYLQVVLDPIMIEPWHHMREWLENDYTSAFETANGRTFWDYASHEPKLNSYFIEAMINDSQWISSLVIRDYRKVFENMKSMVDVGGGTGTMAKAIAEGFPDMSCIVFDLPHVVAGLEGTKNLSYIGGNMFDSIPQADAVMLKWILHNWSDDESVKILKKCKEAIPSKEKGGKVIIIDIIVGNGKADHEAIETQFFYDLSMMVYVNGKERTEKEWANLFFDAGYTGYKIAFAIGLRSLIKVYP
ncbi:O-methyltransferase family protein [Forsythia ovata]|uniref:O-methyltransferase family protein n=1 Tax=Forsythia ovata TaxID=205694 RepID=A0ABD1R858_9LAMI